MTTASKNYYAGVFAGLGAGAIVGVYMAINWNWTKFPPPEFTIVFSLMIAVGATLGRKFGKTCGE